MENLNSSKFAKFEKSKITNLLSITGGVDMSRFAAQRGGMVSIDSATNSGGTWDNVTWRQTGGIQ